MNEELRATVVARTKPTEDQWLARLEACFWPQGVSRNIWMILDAARDRRAFPILQELNLKHSCLYSGSLPLVLRQVAPYLVQLDCDDSETRQFLRLAWGKSWGIFLKCSANANTLHHHLREFLMVRDPSGSRLVFRYYDPRVLRIFLPTCSEHELHMFFGPVERLWAEDNRPDTVFEFSFNKKQLVVSSVCLFEKPIPNPTLI